MTETVVGAVLGAFLWWLIPEIASLIKSRRSIHDFALTGRWSLCLRTVVDGQPVTHEESVEFHPTRAGIDFKATGGPEGRSGFPWTAKLKVHDNSRLVGTYSADDPMRRRPGSVYLALTPDGELAGKWIGRSADHEVAWGILTIGRTAESARRLLERALDQERERPLPVD